MIIIALLFLAFLGAVLLGIGLSGIIGRYLEKGGRRMGMRSILWLIPLVILLLWIGGIYGAVIQDYEVCRDTVAWKERAQVASNPSDMREYMENCKQGMIKYGLTEGHSVFIFPTAENDLTLVMKSIDNIIERCHIVEEMDTNSPEYQNALDDLRGTIRELDLNSAEGYFARHNPLLCIWAWLGWLAFIISLILVAIVVDY